MILLSRWRRASGLLRDRLEVGFGCAAVGAGPIRWQILEGRSWGNAGVWIALGRVVDVTADGALPALHARSPYSRHFSVVGIAVPVKNARNRGYPALCPQNVERIEVSWVVRARSEKA